MKPTYLLADMSHMGEDYPNLWGSPIYLGLGPQVPGDFFEAEGKHHGWRKLRTLEVGHAQNPFDLPVVMAVPLRKGER